MNIYFLFQPPGDTNEVPNKCFQKFSAIESQTLVCSVQENMKVKNAQYFENLTFH